MKLEKDEVIRREKDIYREGTNDVRPQGKVLDAKLSSNAAKFGLRKVRVQVNSNAISGAQGVLR